MTFSNIFDRIGSKLIGLKFVGSLISHDFWIGIIIECFHGVGNTYVIVGMHHDKFYISILIFKLKKYVYDIHYMRRHLTIN